MFAKNLLSAEKQLESFLPFAGKSYTKNRNFYKSLDEKQDVSLLSPAIRHRVINEKTILKKVKGAHGFLNAEKFIQEVFWRTYWKGWLELRPSVYKHYLKERDIQKENITNNKVNNINYNNAISGLTGIECFDEWVNELKSYGYLHNHARMWFASIWIFTLKLPWSLGADFFMCNLLDGDPASNTLSWKWVAGIQTKGKNYSASSSNIKTFTNNKYFPENQLEINPKPIITNEFFNIEINKFQSASIDQSLEYGVVIYADDINIEDIPYFKDLRIKSFFTGQAKDILDDHEISPLVSEFLDSILENKCTELKNQNDIPYFYSKNNFYTEYREWISENNIKNLLVIKPTVGNWLNIHTQIKDISNQNNINIVEIIKEYDTLTWPHATHGFFRFKEKIPKFLSEIEMLI